jgi:hypothetical protein
MLSLVLDCITERDDLVSAIPFMYRTCTSLRKELSVDGFCMRTFSLCRELSLGFAASEGARKIGRVQATIGRQLERTSDQVEVELV